MVNLGDKVKDRINGFEGIVTGLAYYLYGCRQVYVAPTSLAEHGKWPDGQWIDEDRVAVVAPDEVEQPDSAADRAGGPATEALPPGR